MEELRQIIEIDEDLCNGCGQCILDCAEGALQLVDGKAKLVGEFLCDGIGACLGGCPTGALRIVTREAEPFDEEAVEKHLAEQKAKAAPGGCMGAQAMTMRPAACPGSQAMTMAAPACAGRQALSLTRGKEDAGEYQSSLGHWPLKLKLLPPNAPFLAGRQLVLLADCAGLAWPDVHNRLLGDHAVAIACPKFDNAVEHVEKLALILRTARPSSLVVARMEVPCCRGLTMIANEAVRLSGLNLEVKEMVISRQGACIEENKGGFQQAVACM